MPPQSPSPAPPPITPGSDPYGFITNPGQPQKKIPKLLIPSGNSTKSRIIVALIGFVLFVIVASVISTILGSSNRALAGDMVLMAQQQEELRRISEIGVRDSRGAIAKNLAATTLSTIESDQQTFTPIANKVKKIDRKTLSAGTNAVTTVALTEAKQANKFDEVFVEVLQQDLTKYQETVKRVHGKVKDPKNKAVLAQQFENAGLLLDQETTQ